MGEIQSLPLHANIYRSFPHLSICIQSLFSSSNHWCYELEQLNYYSMINLIVTEKIHWLHFWMSISTDGISSFII